MSQKLITLNPDLAKLHDEGYELEIKSNHLLIHNIPYVNKKCEIERGILVSTLNLGADGLTVLKPDGHIVMFSGEYPCNDNGEKITSISNNSIAKNLGDGITIQHQFSNKPSAGYSDYYEKMTRYINIISHPAMAIDSTVSPKTSNSKKSFNSHFPFEYPDLASSRAGINAVSGKLEGLNIAIIGLGGTGSYVLDLVAKTHVESIHLFDGDNFLVHNAFRAPGAALEKKIGKDVNGKDVKKVDYYANEYSNMRQGIIPHAFFIDDRNLSELEGMDFVFLCLDNGSAKIPIIEMLEKNAISFINVGMGIINNDNKLSGLITVTTSTPNMRNHIRENNRIGFSDDNANNEYSKNIQIADLNMLNAALAVIKWKKIYGFYFDTFEEYHSIYSIGENKMFNEDKNAKKTAA